MSSLLPDGAMDGRSRLRLSGPGWTLVLASLGTFLTTLDVIVVATALPSLQRELHVGLSTLEWTINAYNLVFACALLTGAALGDRFGRRRVYVLGLLVFSAGSATAALSGSSGELIAARIVQGFGAAVILPLTLTLITAVFPVQQRGAAIGIWGAVSGLGVAAGPVVGGVILQHLDWQWIFWVNVPVGLVTAVLAATRIRESRGSRSELDVPGLLLVGAGLFGLTYAGVQGPVAGWSTTPVITGLVAGPALLVAFFAWEQRSRHPMLPLSYFRRRGFATANAVMFFQRVSLLGSLFMITQLFQIGLGYSPLQAGVRILVWMAAPMVFAPLAGALSDKVGNRPLMLLGLVMQGGGLGWLVSVTTPQVGYGQLVAPLLVCGIGVACVLPTVANAAVASVSVEDAAIAAGTNTAIGELATVFGIAVVAAVFARHGSYASTQAFIGGFRPGIAVAAVVPLGGVVAAALAPSRAATLATAAGLAGALA